MIKRDNVVYLDSARRIQPRLMAAICDLIRYCSRHDDRPLSAQGTDMEAALRMQELELGTVVEYAPGCLRFEINEHGFDALLADKTEQSAVDDSAADEVRTATR